MNLDISVKIGLSGLLFICLLNMPYGYYQLMRFIALIGFAYLAYHANELKSQLEVFIYIALAVLFQPIFKIALGRQVWNIIDLIVGVGLVMSIILKKKYTNPDL